MKSAARETPSPRATTKIGSMSSHMSTMSRVHLNKSSVPYYQTHCETNFNRTKEKRTTGRGAAQGRPAPRPAVPLQQFLSLDPEFEFDFEFEFEFEFEFNFELGFEFIFEFGVEFEFTSFSYKQAISMIKSCLAYMSGQKPDSNESQSLCFYTLHTAVHMLMLLLAVSILGLCLQLLIQQPLCKIPEERIQ